MSLLLKEVSRWEVVKLVGTHDDFNSLDSRMTIFPILRSSRYATPPTDRLKISCSNSTTFSSIPIGVLRNLCLWQRLLRRDSLTGHWDHLTRLELHDTSSENIIDTLRVSPQQIDTPGLTSLKVLPTDKKHYMIIMGCARCRGEFLLQVEFPASGIVSLRAWYLGHAAQKLAGPHQQTLKVLSITETTSGTPGSHTRSLGASLSMSSVASTSSSSLECEVVETLSTVFLQELNPDRPSSSSFLPVLTELNLTRNSGLKFDRRAFP
ncbi:hypothetical protein DFJ43DRAFT_1162233 [Lentinula guzmanii]|uniref:Uncharacterized protein n=1 Tax=Lentinula guzmanii TaxID=2804957 RepID=A0AA38J8Z3_9AGAR|nr:hypothetical protein DFJ43DRAFT_1162233 [Lentinula guzmanii]